MDRQRIARDLVRLAREVVADDLSEWLQDYLMSKSGGVSEKDILGAAKRFRFDAKATKVALAEMVRGRLVTKKGKSYSWAAGLSKDTDEIGRWLRDELQMAYPRGAKLSDLQKIGESEGFDPGAVEDVVDELIRGRFVVKKGRELSWHPELME